MLARILTIITISCFWEMTYLVERKPVTHKIKTIIKHLSHQGIDAGLLGLSCVASVFILGPDWDLGSMRPGQMFGCISSPFMSASCLSPWQLRQGVLFRWVVCNTGQVAGIVPIELLQQLLNTNCLGLCLSHSSSHHIIQNQFLSPYLFHFSKSIAPNSQ